jgi:hypothetical protein
LAKCSFLTLRQAARVIIRNSKPTHKALFYSFFCQRTHPKSGTAGKEKDLFFCLFYAPSYGQASAKPAAARSFAIFFI